jgi:hypothetical protein
MGYRLEIGSPESRGTLGVAPLQTTLLRNIPLPNCVNHLREVPLGGGHARRLGTLAGALLRDGLHLCLVNNNTGAPTGCKLRLVLIGLPLRPVGPALHPVGPAPCLVGPTGVLRGELHPHDLALRLVDRVVNGRPHLHRVGSPGVPVGPALRPVGPAPCLVGPRPVGPTGVLRGELHPHDLALRLVDCVVNHPLIIGHASRLMCEPPLQQLKARHTLLAPPPLILVYHPSVSPHVLPQALMNCTRFLRHFIEMPTITTMARIL